MSKAPRLLLVVVLFVIVLGTLVSLVALNVQTRRLIERAQAIKAANARLSTISSELADRTAELQKINADLERILEDLRSGQSDHAAAVAQLHKTLAEEEQVQAKIGESLSELNEAMREAAGERGERQAPSAAPPASPTRGAPAQRGSGAP